MLCGMQLSAVFFTLDSIVVDDSAKPGASALLDALDARGVVSAVLTNNPSEPTRTLLETLELIPHALVGTDSERKPMPAPDLLFRACEVLDVPPWEVLLVDCSDAGRQTAASAGCLFAGMNTSGAFTIGGLEDVVGIVDGAGPSR
ncbi:MAG: HAD hydrolase-like protein [Chloroflexi bacterium]|nr:HAD hydrolase-like protein [Chloroflexota bacterium]MXY59123.1 HAD hydrolase-like protein [Chloroflexota bacterium]MYB84426.1 HAD hydrolase-like protein [Chloroflexota bacterium]